MHHLPFHPRVQNSVSLSSLGDPEYIAASCTWPGGLSGSGPSRKTWSCYRSGYPGQLHVLKSCRISIGHLSPHTSLDLKTSARPGCHPAGRCDCLYSRAIHVCMSRICMRMVWWQCRMSSLSKRLVIPRGSVGKVAILREPQRISICIHIRIYGMCISVYRVHVKVWDHKSLRHVVCTQF